jgi:hypothetical protein
MQYTTIDVEHDAFQEVRFKLDYSQSHYDILWVDTAKLIKLCNDPYTPMVSDSNTWSDDKFDSVMSGLVNSNNPGYEIPPARIHLNFAEEPLFTKLKRKLGFKSNKDEKAYVAFTNGRHRTRLLLDLGVRRIPVIADKINQKKLIELANGVMNLEDPCSNIS